MFNRVIMVGNLTKDPEIRYAQSGTAIVSMRVAVAEKVKKGDRWEDETLFMDVVVFGKTAENCSQYLVKGRGILVEGRLKENKWEDKRPGYEGKEYSKMEVIAQLVKFLPSRDKPGAGQANTNETPPSVEPFDRAIPENTTELEPF